MTADQIAAELRDEARRLYRQASRYQEIAMLLEGTHHSLPDDARATDEERWAKLTPEQRERAGKMAERWNRLHPDRPMHVADASDS